MWSTPEQLRTMLQSRELVLRQRFENIIKETTDVRDGLVRIDFSAIDECPDKTSWRAKGKGAEPGEAAAPTPELSAERLLGQRMLQVQWSQQNCRKDAHETGSLADSFLEMREELVNNRIDTAELKLRLEEWDCLPHCGVSPTNCSRNWTAASIVCNRCSPIQQPGARPARQAIQEVDAILLAMRQVLARMIRTGRFQRGGGNC